MVEPALFGPLDAVLARTIGGQLLVEYLLLVLVLANLGTRLAAHRSYVRQARDGADEIARHRGHEAVNVLLVLASFYYLTVHHHAGIVLSTLVLGLFIADLFEFEARQVEARQGWELEKPKGAITISLFVLAYAAFLSVFFVVKPLWNAVI